jgi:Big-like domain-containing protein
MTTRRFLAVLATAVPLGLACGGGGGGSSITGGDKGGGSGPNLNPTIQSVAINPATVPWGGTAVITVVASDPEGQRLSYRYVVAQGTVTMDAANPARAVYTHNGQARPDHIEVTVTDERNGTAQMAGDINISEPPTPPPAGPPPPQPPQPPPPGPGPAPVPPTVSVSVSPRSCHPPCDVTFSASVAGADNFEWSGCAGGVDAGRNVKCTISGLNTVTATCTARNGAGSASASASASGANGAPVVTGGQIVRGLENELNGSFSDPDKDELDCTWPRVGTPCQVLSGCQSVKGDAGTASCKVRIPLGGTGCDMELQCRDSLGASGSTRWKMEL